LDYAIPDLYLAASPDSKTKLLTGFKAAPFVEPATGMAYFRARWYDPSTGTFLTPDPIGYRDSSNLYAYCAGDPVNCSDPLGLESIRQWFAADEDIAAGNWGRGYGKKGAYFAWNALTFGFLGRHDAVYEQYEASGDTAAYLRGTAAEVGRAGVIGTASILTGGWGGAGATTFGGAIARGAVGGAASGFVVTAAGDIYDRSTGGPGATFEEYAAGVAGGALFGGAGAAWAHRATRLDFEFDALDLDLVADDLSPHFPAKATIATNKAAGDWVSDMIALREAPSLREQTFSTIFGSRRVDVLKQAGLVTGIESKVGLTGLDSRVRQELAKDWLLLRRGSARGGLDEVVWEFTRSDITGKIGPSAPLEAMLKKLGFRIVINH